MAELKKELLATFAKLGESMNYDEIMLTDEELFELLDDVIAMDFLSKNELVKIIPKKKKPEKVEVEEKEITEVNEDKVKVKKEEIVEVDVDNNEPLQIVVDVKPNKNDK